MKLIFKCKYKEDWFSKEYVKYCIPFKMLSEISEIKNIKDYMKIIRRKKLLKESYLSSYLCDTDLDLVEYVLDKLNDEKIDYCDIGSQGYDVELENDKVIITIMCSSEEDERACINRKEVVYAMLKWKKFLERKFDNPNYQEIIDTEDVYKE